MNRRDHYRRFVAALLLMCFLAFATYLFFPSAPPWYQFPGQVVKINNQTVSALWDGQYAVSQIYNSFNPNRFAAFPSLHAAFPALAAAYAWSRYRPLAIGLIVWSAAVLISIVYLGEHYVVDALDGYVYVAVAMAMVELVARLRARKASKPATPSA
jgi:membrane-associated phospholipid phosphatase